MPDLTRTPPPAPLLAPTGATTIAARTCLLEGPAFDAEDNLFFSDIFGNRIYRLTPGGGLSVFREDSGRTNGNTFDASGRLISCEGAEQGPGGRRRVVRTDLKTGEVEVLTDRFEGKRYNSPNDVVVDIHGCVWFTDPYYEKDRSILELDQEAVYRIDPAGEVRAGADAAGDRAAQRPGDHARRPDALRHRQPHPPGRQPQGLGVRRRRRGGPSRASAWSSTSAGAAAATACGSTSGGTCGSPPAILFPRHAGENADVPAGVYVITPAGQLLGRIPIPEDLCTNLAFGGPGRRTLHVTSGKTVYKVPLAVSGYALFPPGKV